MMTKTIRKTVLALLLITFHFSLLISIASCSEKRTPEEVAQAEAMEVCQACYDRLIKGDYEGFLSFRNDIDNIPAELRSQIVDAMKMYIDTEERLHGGIKSVMATKAQMDSTLNVMKVFLILSYGNGTDEEVVVPMVTDSNGQWRMK